MKLDSFRLKIALLTLLLSGSVLVAFGLFFVSVISRIGYERIDSELRVLADLQARRPRLKEHWGHFEESLLNLYGEKVNKKFVIKVVSLQGESVYVSPDWPAALPESRLPALEPVFNEDKNYRTPEPERFLPPPNGDAPPRGPPPPMRVRGPVFSTASAGHKSWRLVGVGNEMVNIFIAMDLDRFQAEIRRFLGFLLIALPAALLLIAGGGWLIAHRALRPVKIITRTAETITTRELDRRIPRAHADGEFVRLIDVINGMLDRLEKSFQQAVRFSADAAHELKTPLTILQGELELALQEAPAGSALQRRHGELLEEVQRLAAITRKLLLLAQADSGRMRLSREPFNISSALEAMCEDIAILAPNLSLQKEIEPDVRVMADPDLMNQALHNLVANAVKYNRKNNGTNQLSGSGGPAAPPAYNDSRSDAGRRAGILTGKSVATERDGHPVSGQLSNGWISLELRPDGEMAKFVISNTGEEIQPADRERIFERFYRVDRSRDRSVDGVGLGLSLAREIVLAHRGELVLESSQNGVTVFVMRLPAA